MIRPAILIAFAIASSTSAQDDFPIVPDDMEVALFASDPLVRNPCAITFDAKGRLCVGMGPQYRKPKPDTPGDSVWILLDEDKNGAADGRKEFASGLNNIQGLAWKGDWLWIANAPDLTKVRDTDGDDVADEYVRVFTDLGNLEHGLHGLNFGPDGKLYMSKGNSKGLTQLPDRLAPEPFRKLWGVEVPRGTPEPKPVTTNAADYQKNYHDPADDWGRTGGILRCDDDGSDLEIVARGFRNPWDIAFDDGFDWLGTDNDQTHGDKIFAPFMGADFGWGHAWSYDWKGDDHLPTAPSSGPLFEGSGTGVIYCGLEQYPERYRGVFLINDWLKRQVYIYRPGWEGARRVPKGDPFEALAHAGGGRAMNESKGRRFDPVDIEIGPDGAIWISSWGRQYGAHYNEDGEFANEGRIYRLWPKSAPPTKWSGERDPLVDLGSHLPVWRTNAQETLIKRGDAAPLREMLKRDDLPKALETWAVWTLGRMDPPELNLKATLNQKIQWIRVQTHHWLDAPWTRTALNDPEPRVRLEAVLRAREGKLRWTPDLVERAAVEDDRVVYYAIWQSFARLMRPDARAALLDDHRPAVRRAALLSLLETDELSDDEIQALTNDPDPTNAALARKRLGGKARAEIKGRPLVASRQIAPMPEVEPAINPFGKITPSSGHPYRVATLAQDAALYTDRPYRLLEAPVELAGEAFLQTANDDADFADGVSVQVELKYPATLFLCDDGRGDRPPAWMGDDWQATELTLAATDPKFMRVYRREVPTGTVTLGSNLDGVNGRKSNYILIARPKLLGTNQAPATPEAVRAAMPNADPARGRDLYLSRHGANCAACHRLEDIGNSHAPDLSEIGSRADAEFLIESIIAPSAAITEGFAAQMITTKQGATHTGILLEETGRAVIIAMTGGLKVEVPTADIAERKSLPLSAMPAGFDSMLSAQQIADITAFLLQQKPAAPKAAPPVPTGAFSFDQTDDQLALKLGDTTIATYLLDDPVLTRRAFVNVHSPSGIPVTRQYPAPETADHTHMHPGIWLGFGWIDGNDYWRLQSKVVFDEYLTEPTADGGTAKFAARNRFLNQAGDATVCIEETRYEFQLVPGGILLDVDATYFNDERDFEFGDQEEGGLAVRLAKALSVKDGSGQIVNNHGDRDGKGTWGKEFDWIDYSGTVDGKRIGLMIVPHPDNPRPSWSHARDYGALVANPFPKQPKERREPYLKTTVKKGERFRLRYKVLIHETPAADFDAAALVRSPAFRRSSSGAER